MGTIVYANLVDLLLEEGDKTEKEMIDEAMNRFGFNDGKKLEDEIKFQLMLRENDIVKRPNGKYKSLQIYNDSVTGRKAFLEMVKNDTNPYIKKLKEAIEARMEK